MVFIYYFLDFLLILIIKIIYLLIQINLVDWLF